MSRRRVHFSHGRRPAESVRASGIAGGGGGAGATGGNLGSGGGATGNVQVAHTLLRMKSRNTLRDDEHGVRRNPAPKTSRALPHALQSTMEALIMCRHPLRMPVLLGLFLTACSTSPAPDAGPANATCDLADGRRIPVGAVYNDGCNCCVCLATGGACQAVACVDGGSFQWGARCQSDSDCAAAMFSGAVCMFDQGCSPGQGVCSATMYCPLEVGIAQDYCGCDGQTFHVGIQGAKQYADRPYSHLGACP
jgi:hypothetical protein